MSVNLERFVLMQVRPNHYYLVPVFWTVVAPYLLVVLSIPFLRKAGSGSVPRSVVESRAIRPGG